MNQLSFFENIKLYVGFTDASSAALRELHPIAAPFFKPIVDDFYAAIEATEEAILNALLAAETMTGRGGATVHRLDPDLLAEVLRAHGR